MTDSILPEKKSGNRINRRRLLGSASLALMGLSQVSWSALTQASSATGHDWLLSSVSDSEDKDWWLLSDANGSEQARFALPGRGHGAAIRPDGHAAVLVGRRPATFLAVMEKPAQQAPHFYQVQSAPERHFFGHAAYSRDGSRLFTTENDIASGRGVISVRDATNDYRTTAEWDSGGIGPHQLELLPDGYTLVIANGGILTHPSQPREKLNLDTMQPNLTYLDTRTGDIVASHELADHQLSIRHLNVAADGRVWFGCQYEGDSLDPLTLVYHHRLGEPELTAARAELSLWRQLRHYTGSVIAHPTRDLIGITSPRGDCVTFWDNRKGDFLRSVSLRDVCGLTTDPEGQHFVATTGKGKIALIDCDTLRITAETSTPDWRWDNHLLSMLA